MNNLTLYDITSKFVELMEMAENGELTEEQYNALGEELAIELQTKSSNIIRYVRNSDLLINAMKAEEKRIADLRKDAENKIEKFRQYVKENMEKLNIDKIQTELGTLSIARNPMSVEIENEDEIPDQFKVQVITTKIDKTAIKNHFKETGEVIKGAIIVDDKTRLNIK